MNYYSWQGWGLLPLIQSDADFRKLLSNHPWKHWTDSLTEVEIKDIRRFYTRSSASMLRPMEGGRYVLELNVSKGGCLTTVVNFAKVMLQKIQVIRVGEITLFYLHMNSNNNCSYQNVSEINRSVFSWQPKYNGHRLIEWTNNDNISKPLFEHVGEILGILLDSETDYGEDAFGHELVNCCWIKSEGQSSTNPVCVSELSAGINLSDPRYKLSECELLNLRKTQFSYWKDWRCQLNLNRLVFVDETIGNSALKDNLSGFNYYLDMYAVVVIQRIMLHYFKDELILGNKNKRRELFDKIAAFRKIHSAGHISTYPFAERLYQYFYERADLKQAEEKTFSELEHSHSLWKQRQEEATSSVMFFVSIIAALLLPASSIATIVVLTDEQMNSIFWGTSIAVTLLTIIFVIWPLFSNRNRD